MADKAQITDALKKLDAGNDEHWTQGKEPTVAAVSELVGESVTRDEINAAAEGFTRDTAPGYFMATGKPWEDGNGSQKADGTIEQPKAGSDADGNVTAPAEKDGPNADGTSLVDAPDQNPGQNADGVITAIVHDEQDTTAGEKGDNIDADGDASGVPSGTGFRETEDSPGPPFNPADVSPVPAGDLGTGPQAIGDATESPRSDGAPAEDAESGTGGPVDSDGEAEQPALVESGDSANEIASLEEELRSRKERLDELRVERDKVNKAYQEAMGKVDAIEERIEQLRPRNSNQGTIHAYLESQKKQSAQRGENRQALAAAGIDLKHLQKAVGKAPIDQAMARKTGRGTNRPTRI